MKEYNYFYCLVKSEICDRNILGQVACTGCIKNGLCAICGRQETEFCNRCENKKEDDEE